MSYWGTQRPVLSYGTSYATSWNLETDDVNVYYVYRHAKERNVKASALTQDVSYTEIYSDLKYTSGEVILRFNNLTVAQVDKLLAVVQYPTIKVKYHNDSPNNWSEVYVIKKFVMPAEEEVGVGYPEKDSCYIELVKLVPAEISDDDVT
jgi:hypothetical protein